MIQKLAHRPEPGVGDPCSFELLYDSLGLEAPEDLLDLLGQGIPVGEPVGVAREACVSGQFRALQYFLAESFPLPLVLNAHEHDLAACARKGTVGSYGGVAGAAAVRLSLPVHSVVEIGRA